MKKVLIICLMSLFIISFASAGWFGFDTGDRQEVVTVHVNASSLTNTNSSDFWDDLDVPLGTWIFNM